MISTTNCFSLSWIKPCYHYWSQAHHHHHHHTNSHNLHLLLFCTLQTVVNQNEYLLSLSLYFTTFICHVGDNLTESWSKFFFYLLTPLTHLHLCFSLALIFTCPPLPLCVFFLLYILAFIYYSCFSFLYFITAFVVRHSQQSICSLLTQWIQLLLIRCHCGSGVAVQLHITDDFTLICTYNQVEAAHTHSVGLGKPSLQSARVHIPFTEMGLLCLLCSCALLSTCLFPCHTANHFCLSGHHLKSLCFWNLNIPPLCFCALIIFHWIHFNVCLFIVISTLPSQFPVLLIWNLPLCFKALLYLWWSSLTDVGQPGTASIDSREYQNQAMSNPSDPPL